MSAIPAAFGFCRLFVLIVASLVAFGDAQGCDKSQCKGPVRYYEDLNCKPIYEKEGDCCAVRYDCSNLKGRSTEKCYVNGKEYNIGDQLAKEDRLSPCDIACTCVKNYKDVAAFTCAAVDCFTPPPKKGCYLKKDLDACCGGEEVCPKSNETAIKCEVNGTTYYDGQQFYPSDNLVCQCSKDYKGENIEPFCKKLKCGTELRHSTEISENCSPLFYSSQSPSNSCSYAYRCQSKNDTIIRSTSEKSTGPAVDVSDDLKCKYGNLTLRIGEELNQDMEYMPECVQCKCEVPPLPTCRQLSDKICNGPSYQPQQSPAV